MSSFSAFSVPERQFSDITRPQPGVQDNSSAMATAGLTEGVGALANLGMGIYQNQQQQQASEAAGAFTKEFDEVLRRASQGIDSGELNANKARSLVTMAKRDLISRGADPLALDKQESAKLKTLAGKVLEEGSLEDQAFKVNMQQFMKSDYYNSTATAEQNKQNFLDWEASKAKAISSKAELDKIELELKRADLRKSQRDELVAKQKEIVQSIIHDTVKNLPQSVGNQIDDIVSKGGNSPEELKAKEQALESLRTVQKTKIAAIQSRTGGDTFSSEASRAESIVDSQIDTAIKYLGDSVSNKFRKETLERVNLETGLELQANLDGLRIVAGAATVAQGMIGLELTQRAQTELNKYQLNALTRGDGDSKNNLRATPDDGDKFKNVKLYLDSINNNIKTVKSGKTGVNGEPLVDKDAVAQQVSDVLNNIYLAQNSGERQANVKQLIESIANTPLGDFANELIRENLLPNEDMVKVGDALDKYTGDAADAASIILMDVIPQQSIEEKKKTVDRRGKWALDKKLSTDDLDLEVVGNQIRFVPKHPRAKDVAEEANGKVGVTLTNVMKAKSKVSGETLKEVLEQHKPMIWPSKYSESLAQESPQQEDYSQYEGRTGTDEEGNRFVIRNGVAFKIGGNSDE